jgi:hypothetical protein
MLVDIIRLFQYYGTILFEYMFEYVQQNIPSKLLSYIFYKHSNPPPTKKLISFSDECYIFMDKYKSRFTSWVSSNGSNSNNNIVKSFYDKDEYRTILSDPKNDLEATWKRRILIEQTPYGTVSMYYDPYKHGFSYYCDQRSVSYNILNAVAMKYVRIYCCLDFFVDSQFGWKSPLLDLWREWEKQEEEEKRGKKKDLGLGFLKDAPFALKKKNKNEKQEKTSVEELSKNKFIYIGTLQYHMTHHFFKRPLIIKPVNISISGYKDFKRKFVELDGL